MKTIVLDDGIEYVIIKEIVINNIKYTMFSNINDPEDICLRKTITEADGESYYIGLDDQKEVELVIMHMGKDFLKELNEK